MTKEFTGYHDKTGNKIYLGDYLVHDLSENGDVEGYVTKDKDGYNFGGGFELVNYGAGVTKIKHEHSHLLKE